MNTEQASENIFTYTNKFIKQNKIPHTVNKLVVANNNSFFQRIFIKNNFTKVI